MNIMQNFTFNFNKKLYHLEKLSDFYFQVKSEELPESLLIISDLNSIWIADSNNSSFCSFCFKYRYLCWKKKQVFLSGEDIDKLDDKYWTKKIDEDFLRKLLFCVSNFSSSSQKRWELWLLPSAILETSFELIPYDICKSCNPRVFIEGDDFENFEKEGEEIFDNFNQRLGKVSNKEDDLSTFLLDESVGFVSFFNSFKGSGLPNDFLENTYISTLLTMLPSAGKEEPTATLCGGEDESKSLSKTKATMEFVERYSLKNISYNTSILKTKDENFESFDSSIFDNFSALFQKNLVTPSFKKSFSNYLVWGTDVLKNSKTLVPLQAFFNAKTMLEQYGIKFNDFVPTSSSSGFAAHIDGKKALEKSILELVERDAFIRWWMRPENAISCRVPAGLQSKFQKILSVLSEVLGLDSLEGRLLLLKSPLRVPVLFAFITSKDYEMPPAMLVGAGADFDLKKACEKAISELGIAALNFVARFSKDPNWVEKGVDLKNFQNIRSPQDHIYFYHHSEVLPRLKFLDKVLNLDEVALDKIDGPKNIEQLKEEMKKKGMDWYAIDATPQIFKKFGVFVARSFVPQLYPLSFGAHWPFDLKDVSQISVAADLPHCFP